MAIKIYAGSVPDTQANKKVKYRDIHFDLAEKTNSGNSLYAKKTILDIKASEDEAAIVNSIRNIFTTTPGEKILEPTFGLNLSQWLFQPLDEFTAREIGETILTGIEKYEPRVKVNNVNVDVEYDQHQYTIKLVLTIPSLNIDSKSYDAILAQPGFEFLTNSTA
jgi:phage baseplate assembly protein W